MPNIHNVFIVRYLIPQTGSASGERLNFSLFNFVRLKIWIMEKVISHFDRHGKVFRDQLITVGDLLEYNDSNKVPFHFRLQQK
jgi:hypothetical protein